MMSPRKLEADSNKAPRSALLLALLVLATGLALSPVLFADFIRLDDYSHLFDNPHLRRMSLAGLAAFWTKSYFNLYIPVTYSVWWAVAMVGSLFGPLRESAWLFHGLNLAVHLVNAALVFLVVRTLLAVRRQQAETPIPASDAVVALLSAGVFALHPVQVETVAWISELKGALSTMLGLLGIWWHYRGGKRVLTAGCLVAAMLAKPSAIVFPVLVLLADRILLGRSLRRSVVVPALYSLPLLPLLVVTKHLQPDTNLDFIPSLWQRLAIAADALIFYLAKVLIPLPLAVDYGRSPQYVLGHVPGWQIALAALVSVAGVAVVVKTLVRPAPPSPEGDGRALLSCGWAFFLLSLTPVLGLVPFGFQQFSTVADHYLYVPLLGGSLMVAGVLVRFGGLAHSRRLATVVLLAFAVLSFRQARFWHSTESLFAHTVKVNPRSYLGCHSIAEEHLHAGRFQETIAWDGKALAIRPDYVNAQIGLGLALVQQGDDARASGDDANAMDSYTKAMDHYAAALARNPSIVGTRARFVSSLHNNLGMLLLRLGRTAEAIEHFRKAIAIWPRSLNAHLNLGNIAFQDGRYLDAIAEYERAQALGPGLPAVELRLARARQAAQRSIPDGTPAQPAAPF
jgi:tetratricopeptide (TPR) repeat protein